MDACMHTQVEKRETRAMGVARGSTKRPECGATKVSPGVPHRCSSGLDLIVLVNLSRSLISQSEIESGIVG
jgi:hypothetical protein